MSKLRDRLRDTTRRSRGGLGFAPGAARPEGGHVLVVAEVDTEQTARAARDGGAAVLLYAGVPAGLGAVVAATDLPVGVRLHAATADGVRAATEAHADFFVFDDARTAADALLERRLGRVLLLDGDPDEERLRLIAPLDLDAILLAAPPAGATVRDHLRLRRIVELARAPLLISLAQPVGASTLEAWRDAGAPAVLLPLAQAAHLATVVQAATAVRPPTEQRADQRPEPFLQPLTSRTLDVEGDDFDD